MWIYLQVSDKWDSTVDGRSTDEVVIFDVLGVLIWQIHHQVYIFILNQSVTKQQQQWELKNFNTQNNNLEAKARNASKPAHFWLPILSFLQSQFTCKNWFAFVNNSVPWILITWSCGGDTHRSPGHPMGCLQITKTSHGECAQMKWTYHGGERAPIRWTHNGTCAHIKGTSHIRSLTKEQSVRRFRAAWFLEDFVRKGKSFRI